MAIINTITVYIDEGALKIIDATDSYSDFDGGEFFELDCCFYSHPYCPTITWYKDGVEIIDGLTIRKIKQGRALQVYARPDAGGNYTCTATTPYGEFERHTITNVKIISKFDMYLYRNLFLAKPPVNFQASVLYSIDKTMSRFNTFILHLHCKMFAKVWGCCNFLLLQHVWNCE
jgi:hypothetical protein